MAWTITDRFPLWGEDGELPPDGFFYEGGDQVNEKHLDALWNGIKELENETRSALADIDSDNDGQVDEADEADSLIANANLQGDLTAADGTTIWDDSVSYIPQGRLENDSVTIAGNVVSIGGSTAINHNDTSNISTDDHHTRYTDGEAITAVNAETSLTVDISGDADTVDGFDQSGLAKLKDGVQTPIYASLSDVPSSISEGEIIYNDAEGSLYVENGT
jgi:hypothetical protein